MRPFGISLVVLTAILGVPAPASAATGTTTRVSVASNGAQANDSSEAPAVSSDGRYVAFESFASNLVPGDTNSLLDVFVRDRDTGGVERVSVAADGTQGNSHSGRADVSSDGRFVAFDSIATNLVPGDTNGHQDVFVRDRKTGSIERVNISGGGAEGNSQSITPSISADGRYVAFRSFADNLVPGDTNNQPDVFVRDRQAGSTARVSVATGGTQANGFSLGNPKISADGRYVAFESLASNLVPGDTNGNQDVFVHDRNTGGTERVNVAGDGSQSSGGGAPSISADGRYVAFGSGAGNLVPGDTNGNGDVFVRDRTAGSTERVSVAGDGSQANSISLTPSISADGRHVAFRSLAGNLVPGDTNGLIDVFVHDRDTGGTEWVTVARDGGPANANSFGVPPISADGRYIAFGSPASNLVPGDTNGTSDVFVRDRQGIAPSDTTPPALTVPDPITADATGPAGATVAYPATATDDTDPNPAVSCEPASGSTFPIGDTMVGCTATDATGNQSTGSFTVTVVGAGGQLEDLEALIRDYPLTATVEASLLNKVTGAQDAVAAGKTAPACSKLADFLGQVADFRKAGKLTAEQAAELTTDATRIRAVLGC